MIISFQKYKRFGKEKQRFCYSPGYNYCNLFQAYEFLFPNINVQEILFAPFTIIMIFPLSDPHDFCYCFWLEIQKMNELMEEWMIASQFGTVFWVAWIQ